MRFDCATVHFHQPLDQRQADAQAALGMLECQVDLREHVEYAAHHVGRYTQPVVGDADHNRIIVPARQQHNAAARLSVFGRVAQQVGQYLGHSGGVCMQPERLVGQLNDQRRPGGVHGRQPRCAGKAFFKHVVPVRAAEQQTPELGPVLRTAFNDDHAPSLADLAGAAGLHAGAPWLAASAARAQQQSGRRRDTLGCWSCRNGLT